MTLGWLLLVVAVIILLVSAIRRSNRKARQTGTAPKPLVEHSVVDLGPASTEFVTALKQTEALRQVDSPQLERVRELNRQLDHLYPCRITSLQKDQIEMTVAVALEGKQVSWELTVDNVSERPQFFSWESKDMGGFWIKHVEHPPFLVAECQTFNRDVLYLPRGQSIIASGCIAKVKILWPSLLLMVTDTAVSRRSDDGTVRPEAVPSLGTEPTLRQQPPSVGREFQTLRMDSGRFRAGEPSYQTAPLTEYSSKFLKRAEELFEIVNQHIGQKAKRYKGSFSIFAQSCSETAAKIVIYQQGLGRENGAWPALADGIYVLVRRNGSAGLAIWEGGLLRSSAYQQRLDPVRTLGIAPKHHERFSYFRLEPGDETRVVAELLINCASA